MFFSNLIIYFIILSTAATLHKAGINGIQSATQAAQALEPLAGHFVGVLFLLGVAGVGFLAVPVMTTGAAYDVAQTLGWQNSFHAKPHPAKKFYAAVIGFTLIGVAMNFLGFNPMRPQQFSLR